MAVVELLSLADAGKDFGWSEGQRDIQLIVM